MNKVKNVLLVEDNQSDELLTLRALKELRVANQIDVVRDGQAELDYFFAEPARALPAVVLLDLKLPKVDGHQVLEALRQSERTRIVPVVILTSSDDEQDIMRAYESGVNSFVNKPVGSEEFKNAIKELGMYWMLTNKPPA